MGDVEDEFGAVYSKDNVKGKRVEKDKPFDRPRFNLKSGIDNGRSDDTLKQKIGIADAVEYDEYWTQSDEEILLISWREMEGRLSRIANGPETALWHKSVEIFGLYPPQLLPRGVSVYMKNRIKPTVQGLRHMMSEFHEWGSDFCEAFSRLMSIPVFRGQGEFLQYALHYALEIRVTDLEEVPHTEAELEPLNNIPSNIKVTMEEVKENLCPALSTDQMKSLQDILMRNRYKPEHWDFLSFLQRTVVRSEKLLDDTNLTHLQLCDLRAVEEAWNFYVAEKQPTRLPMHYNPCSDFKTKEIDREHQDRFLAWKRGFVFGTERKRKRAVRRKTREAKEALDKQQQSDQASMRGLVAHERRTGARSLAVVIYQSRELEAILNIAKLPEVAVNELDIPGNMALSRNNIRGQQLPEAPYLSENAIQLVETLPEASCHQKKESEDMRFTPAVSPQLALPQGNVQLMPEATQPVQLPGPRSELAANQEEELAKEMPTRQAKDTTNPAQMAREAVVKEEPDDPYSAFQSQAPNEPRFAVPSSSLRGRGSERVFNIRGRASMGPRDHRLDGGMNSRPANENQRHRRNRGYNHNRRGRFQGNNTLARNSQQQPQHGSSQATSDASMTMSFMFSNPEVARRFMPYIQQSGVSAGIDGQSTSGSRDIVVPNMFHLPVAFPNPDNTPREGLLNRGRDRQQGPRRGGENYLSCHP